MKLQRAISIRCASRWAAALLRTVLVLVLVVLAFQAGVTAPTVLAADFLTVTNLTSRYLVYDSNQQVSNLEAIPDLFTVGLRLCNDLTTPPAPLTDVRVYIGTYDATNPQPGIFPTTGAYSLSLIPADPSKDAVRELYTLEYTTDPNLCGHVFWEVEYPQAQGLTLEYDVWYTVGDDTTPHLAGQYTASERVNLSTSTSTIESVTIAPAPANPGDPIPVDIGEKVIMTVVSTFATIGHGDDTWVQPLGRWDFPTNTQIWDPSKFVLSQTILAGDFVSGQSTCHIARTDELYLENIDTICNKNASWSGTITTAYEFTAVGEGTNTIMMPYQLQASGNQEKYVLRQVSFPIHSSNSCAVTLDKTVTPKDVIWPESPSSGDLTYTIKATNTSGKVQGRYPAAPLIIWDDFPSASGDIQIAQQVNSPTCDVANKSACGCVIRYCTEANDNRSCGTAVPTGPITAIEFVYENPWGEGLTCTPQYKVAYTLGTTGAGGVVTGDPATTNFDTGAVCKSSTSVTTTPVTLAYFQAAADGGAVSLQWSTATETANAGFNLYVESEGGREKVNAELIPSKVIDSTEPQDYSYQAAGVAGQIFYVEDVSVFGRTRLHGPFELDRAYGERVQVEPVDWAAIRAEHEAKAAERAEASLAQASVSAAQAQQTLKTKQAGTAAEQTAAIAASGYPPFNLKVDKTGLYRVTYEALAAAGLNLAGVQNSNIALTNRGAAVPITVGGPNPIGPGSYIEFVGQALDTLYTQTNVYTLLVDSTLARRVAVNSTKPKAGAPLAPYYLEQASVNRNLGYSYLSPSGDPWYEASIFARTAPVSRSFAIGVEGYLAGQAPASLTVKLWGSSDPVASPDHHVRTVLNGATVADTVFDGVTVQDITAQLPEGVLVNGANTLQLTLPVDLGTAFDIVAVDRYAVTYPRAFNARGDQLAFTATGQAIRVNGLSSQSIVVYRIVSGTPTRLTGLTVGGSAGAYSVTFAGTSSPASYFVSTAAALAVPGITPARPVTDITSSPASYLVISHPDFIAGLTPLVQARRAQGLSVRVTDVQDVYARFSYGMTDPQAIRDYIRYAAQDMGTQYVLLVGSDTYDYFNYLGNGSFSFIPSLYAATGSDIYFAPVDPKYADLNDDGVPDLAIGRFPVRTSAELGAIVRKTLAYQDQQDYRRTAVFAADKGFRADSESFANQLTGWTVTKAYLDDLGVTNAKTALIGALNGGAAFASYVGHSGQTIWSFDRLFTMADAAALTNVGRPAVVSQWGCWNSYYVEPAYNTLAHKFLLSGDQGAAAVMGASTLGLDSSQAALGQLFTPKATQPGMTIGMALQAAKVELAVSQPGLVDVQLGWTLLGDPALVVEPVEP